MKESEVKSLSPSEFRDWITRLNKENKIKEISKLCAIRLGKSNDDVITD